MKILWIASVVSIILFVVGFIPIFPESFGLCRSASDFICLAWFENQPIYNLAYLTIVSPILFIISVALLLRLKSPEIFQSWKKFARIYLPVSFLIGTISFIDEEISGGGNWGLGNMFGFEFMFGFLTIIFFLVSLVIIIVKWWKLRKTQIS